MQNYTTDFFAIRQVWNLYFILKKSFNTSKKLFNHIFNVIGINLEKYDILSIQ